MKPVSPKLIFALLVSLAYTLGTCAHLRAVARGNSDNRGAFQKILGEGRRLFSSQFVTMADVYLHSGYYPSIFDQRDTIAPKAVSGGSRNHESDQEAEPVRDEHTGAEHDEHAEHEKAMNFMGKPHDWLEAFIRRFRITKHTHLAHGKAREVLPWLQLAIDLDPQAIGTYTATAYWLRTELSQPKEAEDVLREGIRNNPNSYELLFEMGMIFRKEYRDTDRARNIWILALKRWQEQPDQAKSASLTQCDNILVNLANLERSVTNNARAIYYLELAKQVSPNPAAVQTQIDKLKLATQGGDNHTPSGNPVR